MAHTSVDTSIQHVSDYDEYLQLISGSCVVKFTAGWCGPCKKIAPQYEKLASDHKSLVKFIEIDLDSSDEITDYENVQSIPYFVFFKDGKKQTSLTINGAQSALLDKNIESLVAQIRASKLAAESKLVEVTKLVEESKLVETDILAGIADDEDIYSEQSDDEPEEVLYGEGYSEPYDEDDDKQCEQIIEKTISENVINL